MKAILIPVAVILISLVILTIMVVSRINLNKKANKQHFTSKTDFPILNTDIRKD